MNNFDYSLSIGKKVEDYTEKYLISRNHTVINHSEDKKWQDIDTDFEIHKNGQSTTLEVKADSKINKNGNFFFEVGFDRATGYYAGWFDKCKAEYICFIDYVGGKGYIVHFDRDTIKKNSSSRRWYNYTDQCYGDAYLLNVDKARQLGLVSLEWDIEEEIVA